MKYEIIEISNYSKSALSDGERCDKIGYVRLQYFNENSSPYLDLKKIKKAIDGHPSASLKRHIESNAIKKKEKI